MKKPLLIEFRVFKLADLTKYFIEGLQSSSGQIVSVEHWTDIVKGEVCFKIYVDPQEGGDNANPVHPIPAARRGN